MTAYSPALDGLRGVAIILVLLHHFTILQPHDQSTDWLAQAAWLGWSGVDLFFVLSGFLITGILIDARGSPRYFTSFYARRTLRIFPLYYLIVFLVFVVLPYFPAWHKLLVGLHQDDEWPYWTYLMNFAIAADNDFEHGVLDVAWSLAIEEQFYLVWAAVVWLWPPRLLGALCAAIIAATPVARWWALAEGAMPIDVYLLTPFRVDSLAVGALLAWLIRRGWLAQYGRLGLLVALLALIAVVAVCLVDRDTWWWGPMMQRVGYSLLATAAAGMVVGALVLPAAHTWPRVLSAGWLRAFGKYSYCLYLIHLPVMRIVRQFVIGPDQFAIFGSPWVGQVLFYAITTLAAFAIAWTSWRVFEQPILRLKTRFPY